MNRRTFMQLAAPAAAAVVLPESAPKALTAMQLYYDPTGGRVYSSHITPFPFEMRGAFFIKMSDGSVRELKKIV